MKLRTTILCCAVNLAFAAPVFAATVQGGRIVPPLVKDPAISATAGRATIARPKAQEPEKVSLPALSAEQIVEKNILARGGLAAWKGVQSMTLEGKLDAGKKRQDGGNYATLGRTYSKAERRAYVKQAVFGRSNEQKDEMIQLPFKMELKRPRQSRVEVEFQGKTAVQVYDGANGWKLRPFIGRHQVETFTAEEMKAASQQQELDGPLVDYAAKGTKVALAGTEKVDGRGAYKLALTMKDGAVRNVWIDAQSFLEIKMDGVPRRMDGKARAVSTWFRDYKAVDGLMIPHLVETRVEGVRDGERILVERVALNAALDNTRFAKPD
jgi:hypothetical protein